MQFNYTPTSDTGLLAAFGEATGSVVTNGVLTIADTLGKGVIRGFDLSPSIRMMVHQYVLTEELIFRRMATKQERGNSLTITFQNVLHGHGTGGQSPASGYRLPSVQVTSADMDFETVFPAHTEINTIIIAVRLAYLNELVPAGSDSVLQTLLAGTQPCVYEAISSPQIQDLAAQLLTATVPALLHDFYYKLKAEELIYLFLLEFIRRQHVPGPALRPADVTRMYALRDKLMADLSVLPNLPDLARFSGISESKMTRLFRQIFGSSIYDYYQTLRMHEAAYLIREQTLSIAEAGYRVGFSNLSHFSRLFEKHYGTTPKRFAMNR